MLCLTVNYHLTDELKEQLEEALIKIQNTTKDDGTKPFENYSLQDALQIIMEIGSFHDIKNKINDFKEVWK